MVAAENKRVEVDEEAQGCVSSVELDENENQNAMLSESWVEQRRVRSHLDSRPGLMNHTLREGSTRISSVREGTGTGTGISMGTMHQGLGRVEVEEGAMYSAGEGRRRKVRTWW